MSDERKSKMKNFLGHVNGMILTLGFGGIVMIITSLFLGLSSLAPPPAEGPPCDGLLINVEKPVDVIGKGSGTNINITFRSSNQQELGYKAAVMESSSPIEMKIRFIDAFSSIQGLWRGETAVINTKGALEEEYIGTPGNTGVSFGSLLSNQEKLASPYFEVGIPINQISMDQELEDRKTTVGVSLKVVQPALSTNSKFAERERELTHSFVLYVLTEDEYSECKKIQNRNRNQVYIYFAGFVLIDVCLFAVPLYISNKYGVGVGFVKRLLDTQKK